VNRWQLRLQPKVNGPPERRRTLTARLAPGSGNPVYQIDAHLQGDDETVFFEI
jgi:protocatechuate 3,4-dioxygenase alpha subunit